jgi:hypothetical protein
MVAAAALLSASATSARMEPAEEPDREGGGATAAQFRCSSVPGGRQRCTADTTAGITLVRSTGQFSRKFSLYGGINGLPGTRSLQGSHPLWLGHDRVMADEYFRPYFSQGLWAQGEVTPGLWYNAMVANNLSALGVKATELDRKASGGASVWWMPTTHEFGPRGAFGEWEAHEEIATRFGISTVFSPEQRFTDGTAGATGNTTIRLADSLNVFDTGSLAPGVTVESVDYYVLSVDAGMKYRGWFLQFECYNRWLDGFEADGPLPVDSIQDAGFSLQGARSTRCRSASRPTA